MKATGIVRRIDELGSETRGVRRFFRGGCVYACPSFARRQGIHKEQKIICGNRAKGHCMLSVPHDVSESASLREGAPLSTTNYKKIEKIIDNG